MSQFFIRVALTVLFLALFVQFPVSGRIKMNPGLDACPKPPNIPNGEVKKIIWGPSRIDVAVYSCNAGYMLRGYFTRLCIYESGKWTGEQPKCVKTEGLNCPEPGDFRNGKVFILARGKRRSARYLCDDGYKMKGPGVRLCNRTTSKWTRKEPKCVLACRPKLDAPPNGRVKIIQYINVPQLDMVAKYTCNDGYILKGSTTRDCRKETDKWTGEEPLCSKLNVRKPKAVGEIKAPACPEDKGSFSLNFARKGIRSYTSVKGMPFLEAITACFWMRSSEQNTFGTPISYASGSSLFGNDFTVYNYKNFQIFVNNKHSGESSVSANDGKWHHLCFTWENTAGSWNIYKDGVNKKKGSGLSKGYTITAGGLLVLGQDQDKVEGAFQEIQSFVGDLSGVNIWNRVLSKKEISQLSKSCDKGEGNVFRWSNFKSGIHGQVKVNEPSTCKAD